MKQKYILRLASLISIISRPLYLPLVGLASMFLFSPLSMLPLVYKLVVLFVVWVCTVLMPALFIRAYRHYRGQDKQLLLSKEHLVVPYAISIVCYLFCYIVLNSNHVPHFMTTIVITALILQITCALINLRWKISNHTAAIGCYLGGLLAFSIQFFFNPTWWFCMVCLLSGVVGTCRMILRQHTLPEVAAGWSLGFLLALIAIPIL